MIGRTSRFMRLRWLAVLLLSLLWVTMGGAAPSAQRSDFGSPSLAAKTIDPATVRFSQSSISPNFSAGGSVDDLAAGLRGGTVKAGEVPAIRLVEKEGSRFTLDNRRLEAFRRAETPVPYRMATPEEAAAEAWKFTTKNGGTSIRVRGQ
jgi:hypothetical protein